MTRRARHLTIARDGRIAEAAPPMLSLAAARILCAAIGLLAVATFLWCPA